MRFKKRTKGFTLIEILIVIGIISILAVVGFGQYNNSLRAGRDGRRKTDLQTIQRTLEEYYQDLDSYPSDSDSKIPDPLCHPSGCGTTQYIQRLPTDPGGTPYVYISDGTYYRLYACIENPNDAGPGVNQSGYGQVCGGGRCDPCRFGVSSTNISP